MEYLLLLVCIVPIYFIRKHMVLSKKISVLPQVKHSQSRSMLLLGKILDAETNPKKDKRQSTKFINQTHLRVMIYEDNAYWIANNVLYSAKIEDDEIDNSSAIEVDTMTMDDVQLKKTMYIVERLTEGLGNEGRDQRYS